MKTFLLYVFFFSIIQTTFAQDGRPDPTFGSNGVVKADLGKHYLSQPGNSGFKVLDGGQEGIFIAIESFGETFISKRHVNGTPDSSYGVNGYSVITAIKGNDAVMQKDGKIIIGGFNGDNSYNNFALARYNTDGKFDTTFSGDGLQASTTKNGYNFVTSLALQSDGRIIAVGYINQDFGVARYTVDGNIDSSFSGDGKQVTDFFGFTDVAESVVIQEDDKIIVSGYATNSLSTSFAIARYTVNGGLDNSFSEDGKQFTFFEGNGYAYSSAIQDDGRIVVAGFATPPGGNVFALSRYNADGTPDNTFDFDGRQTSNPGTGINFEPRSIAIQNDHKIILASSLIIGDNYDVALLRFNVNGSPDSTFSTDGIQTTDFNGGTDYARSVTLQRNGKILISGEFGVPGNTGNFGLARYNTDGSLDNTFGKNGNITGKLKQGNTVYKSTAVQTDGKIVAAGYTWNGEKFIFAVSRFNPDGSPDSTFSGDGTKTTSFGKGDDYGNSVALMPDGRIVVGGSTQKGRNRDFAFARYTVYGEPDSTFNGNGKKEIAFGTAGDDYANAITVQADGKVVAAGVSKNNTALVRLTVNGDPDSTFGGGDGMQVTDYGDYSVARSIIILQNGRIVTGGISGGDFTLARYTSNGYLDKTFAINGKLKSNFGYDFNSVNSIAIQEDGKIVAAVDVSYLESTNGFLVARFTPSGNLDSLFGANGKVVPDNTSSFVNSVALQSDGKILTGGTLGNHSSITRINIDGTLDSTFGENGMEVSQTIARGDFVYGIAIQKNSLYAAGTCFCPGSLGTLIKYQLGTPETNGISVNNRTIATILQPEAINTKTGLAGTKIFPNPAHDYLNINTTGTTAGNITGIAVISPSGVIMKTVRIKNPAQNIPVNISTLRNGVYTLRLQSRNMVIYKQFIKM